MNLTSNTDKPVQVEIEDQQIDRNLIHHQILQSFRKRKIMQEEKLCTLQVKSPF